MIRTLKESLTARLSAYYDIREAEVISRILLEHAFGAPYAVLSVSSAKDRVFERFKEKKVLVESWLTRLLAHEPIQYILEEAYFFRDVLTVRHGVLIPRPETEYLIELIARDPEVGTPRAALDLGTGSGAIAIALARCFPDAEVDAVDVSTEALEVAELNVRKLGLEERVEVSRYDLLSGESLPRNEGYDLFVSNPPYILPSERKWMHPHVLEQEPEVALFVPEEDPLLFYRIIMTLGKDSLHVGGHIFFECNPYYIHSILELGTEEGYDASPLYDQYGRGRFVKLRK